MRPHAVLTAAAAALLLTTGCGDAEDPAATGGTTSASTQVASGTDSSSSDVAIRVDPASATAPAGPGELFVYGDDDAGKPLAAVVDVASGEAQVIATPPIHPDALALAAARVGDHILLVGIRCDDTLGSESEECAPGTYEFAVLPLGDDGPGEWVSLELPDGLRDTESLLARPFGALDDRRLVIQAGPGWDRHWIVDVVAGSFEEVPLPPGDVDDSCLAGTHLVAIGRPPVADDGTPQTLTPESTGPASASAWWVDLESGEGWEPLPALVPGVASTTMACTSTHALVWDSGRLSGLRALAIDDPTAWTIIEPPEPSAFAQYTASEGGEIVFEDAPEGRWRLDPSGPTWTAVPLTGGNMYEFHWVGDELLGWEYLPGDETPEASSRPVRIELTAPD